MQMVVGEHNLAETEIFSGSYNHQR